MKASPLLLYGGGALVALLVVYLIARNAKGIAKSTGEAAAETVGDTIAGLAVGIGKAFGIPDTDAAKCRAALDARELGNALVYCSAGEFNRGWFKTRASSSAGELVGVPWNVGGLTLDSPGGYGVTGAW